LRNKTQFPIVVKTPKGLLEEPYYSCAVCGKKFRDGSSLKDHFNAQRKNDLEHKIFSSNKLTFQNINSSTDNSYTNRSKVQHKPKFGRINIKSSKDE
jgi:hypothetical protein